MGGWVKIHRSLINNCYWLEEPFTRGQAWIDLILLANHKQGHIRKRGILVEIGRGQVGHGQQTLADRWNWSRGKVIRFLKELEIKQQVIQQKTNVTTVISLINYEKYQHKETPNNTVNDTASDTAGEQQTVPEQEKKELLKKTSPGRVKDLKKLAAGNQDTLLGSQYSIESGLHGASWPELQAWAVAELKKIERLLKKQ